MTFRVKNLRNLQLKNKCIFVSNHPTNPSKNIYNEHIRNLNFVNLNGNIIDEILSKADIIITDFSSIFADFLLFDKPIIFSKFDYNNYVKSSGLKIDYNSLPGPKVKNWDELLAEIDTFLNSDDNYKNQREDWKKKVYNYLDGKNSERIANYFKQWIYLKIKKYWTGHKFRSYFTFWLLKYGAKITGISKDIPTSPSHYKSLNLQKSIKEYFLKIEDKNEIEKVILKEKPDFVFHLAAQAIVSKSFDNPFETWKSNTFGTLSILEALRKVKKTMYVVLITSDKSYKNIEIKRGYKETILWVAMIPISASKGSADILINSYIKSFFMKNKVFISVARAGNVIGGGDWSDNRLIPDCVKSCSRNKNY